MLRSLRTASRRRLLLLLPDISVASLLRLMQLLPHISVASLLLPDISVTGIH